jgi:Zn-dependent peptidase ImmA (M78 family)/transcriptional regulator with XRE-family HTH domain
MIYGARVREVRELRDLTQVQLAEMLGVDHSAIAHIESGRKQPSPEVLAGIAEQTGFPIEFFSQDEPVEFPLGSLLFRARGDMTAKQKAQAHRYGELIYRRTARMARRLSIPPVHLPRLDDMEPEAAAAHTRAALGLAHDRPIRHLINAVERAGVIVVTIPVRLDRREAYSLWVGEEKLHPVIVVVGGVPGDRLRNSVAHEIGHLVRPAGKGRDTKTIEAEASRFGEALLLPGEAMRAAIVPPVTLGSLADLKQPWGVSIQLLIHRARTLGIITPRQYSYLFEQIGRRGWRTREPVNLDVPVEKPRAVRKMAELLYGDPIDYVKFAADMQLAPLFARHVMEAHASREDLPPPSEPGDSNVVPLRRLRIAAG